ncbi:MAG: hypothetical protein HFE86_01100 [Clostridiales bacterium]|nr:hypothetical protein [Clostridiales bacterium]
MKKLKYAFYILAGLFAVVTVAAGAAVLIYRFIGEKKDEKNYIECECDPEYT